MASTEYIQIKMKKMLILKYIDTSRIKQELSNNKIVIIAGFQGINSNGDISTLGRGGDQIQQPLL